MAWSIFTGPQGDQTAVQWAEQTLQQGHYPVDPGTVQFVYDWEKSEGGGGKYNPLNQGPVPGHPELTTTGSQYGGGAADFASVEAGIQGALDYLNFSNYAGVKAGLAADNPTAARAALIASPWAGSHYGYGRAFNTSPLPAGTVVGGKVTGGTDLLGQLSQPATLTSSSGGGLGGGLGQIFPGFGIGGLFGGGGPGSSLINLTGLKTYLLDAALVVFGLVAILVALVIMSRGASSGGFGGALAPDQEEEKPRGEGRKAGVATEAEEAAAL